MEARRFAYGPVPSRRLGLSLGVDLIPFKVCCYDCIYCQLGPTRRLSVEREEFAPVSAVVEGVRQALETGPTPDVITLAGSGEPTLYAPLGELISALKILTSIPIALLTNGALFGERGVRADAALSDLVLPSLDAGEEGLFRLVNRPHESLTLDGVLAGLESFRDEYAGPIWLEIMMVAGIQDRDPHLRYLAKKAERLRPDRIHLNTPARPSPLGPSAAIPGESLLQLCARFSPRAEAIQDFRGNPGEGALSLGEVQKRLFDLLSRRPCTVEDASIGLAVSPNVVAKAMSTLEASGRVRRERQGDRLFFTSLGKRG
jgi:wyosine [tRNA(Phe)-imidazoG37] synthetase (radical SAM superfamily)